MATEIGGATLQSDPADTSEPINHDRLFKLLLTVFFLEFIQLFLPDVAAYLDPSLVIPINHELFDADPPGNTFRADLVMQVRFRPGTQIYLSHTGEYKIVQADDLPELATFQVHIEVQSTSDTEMGERVLNYYTLLRRIYGVQVYPVVVYSYDTPKKAAPHTLQHIFPNKKVLDFDYDVIQLNRLDWHTFLEQPNPVAALMSKMQMTPEERPLVKAHCIAMLMGLELDRDKVELVTTVVDSYLRLDASEYQQYRAELERISSPQVKERTMQYMTDWEQQGVTKGRAEGQLIGKSELVGRQLVRKLGGLSPELAQRTAALSETQLDELAEALLDFQTQVDLETWLAQRLAAPSL